MSRALAADRRRDEPAPLKRAGEVAAFCLIAAIFAVRPLLSESFESVDLSFLPDTGGMSPALSTVLDLLLLLGVAIGCSIHAGRRAAAPSRAVGRIATVGAALLILGLGASTVVAADRRLALNAGCNVAITVLAALTLARLAREPWMARLLVAAVLASGAVAGTKCLLQRAYEFDDTLEFWEQQKPQLAARGVDLSEPALINYERRLRSAEAFGYQAHPNLAASHLLMCLFPAAGAALGALAGGRRGWIAAGVALAVAALSAVAIFTTGSSGALLSIGFGAALLAIAGWRRQQISKRPALAAAALGGVYLAGVLLLLGIGLSTGTLPGSSLAFRWEYWTAALRGFLDAPLTGVGRGNFGDLFLLYKSPQMVEEVRDPHNLWVSLLVKTGPLGLAGGILMAAAAIVSAVRAVGASVGCDETARDGATRTHARRPPHAVIIAGLVLATHVLCLVDQIGQPGMAILWLFEVALVWVGAFAALLHVLERLEPLGRAWLGAGLLAALAAQLVHSLVDFALLTPAGLATWAALAAAAARAFPAGAVPAEPAERRGRAARIMPGLLLLAGAGCYAWFVTGMTAAQGAWSRTLREAALGPRAVAAGAVQNLRIRVEHSDPLGSNGAMDAARVFLAASTRPDLSPAERAEYLASADADAALAARRRPNAHAIARMQASIAEQRRALAEARGDDAAARSAAMEAAQRWEVAVSRYPTNPRDHLAAGQALVALWRRSNDARDAARARAHFDEALRIDATRKPEEVMRLRDGEHAAIRAALELLGGANPPSND